MPKQFKKLSSAAAIETTLKKVPANRAGLPAQDSIIAVTETPKFKILHTEEVDRYEKGALGLGLASAVRAAAPSGDKFGGTDRKAAKLSISTADIEKFRDVKDVIGSLVAEADMKAHKPKIKTTATSGRVQEEERNIRVNAFIYAASREADNDFHLIVGRDPSAKPEMYMTMELSGLPPDNSASFAQLQAARDAFKKFFNSQAGGNLPGTSYDFYDPPLAVTVEGSLFFDMTHASGSRPGPASLKSRMPVIWEVHPISKIEFK